MKEKNDLFFLFVCLFLIFWSTGKTAKKIGLVARQNKNNII